MRMKQGLLYLALLLLAVTIFYACNKNLKSDLDKTSANGTKARTVIPDADTVHFKEADSLFQVTVASGAVTALTSSRYVTVRAHHEGAAMYFLENGLVALYMPVGYDVTTGRVLKFVVLKENNKYRRAIFVEKEPTAAWRALNQSYDVLTGTIRFFNTQGVLVKQYAMNGGLAGNEIPIGGGSSSVSVHHGAGTESVSGGDPTDPNDPAWLDADEDNDGVKNKNDKCLRTPAGVFVDINGCPLHIDLNGVTITADAESGDIGFLPIITPAGGNAGPPIFFPVDFGGSPAGGPATTAVGLKYGTLCGDYSMIRVGTSGVTGEFHNVAEGFVNPSTGANFIVKYPLLCVQINNNSPIKASQIFVDAFNWAVFQLNNYMDDNGGLDPVTAGAKLLKYTLDNLNEVAPTCTISTGICGGNIPITDAKQHNLITGDCEKI